MRLFKIYRNTEPEHGDWGDAYPEMYIDIDSITAMLHEFRISPSDASRSDGWYIAWGGTSSRLKVAEAEYNRIKELLADKFVE